MAKSARALPPKSVQAAKPGLSAKPAHGLAPDAPGVRDDPSVELRPRLAHTSSGADQPEVVLPTRLSSNEPEYLVIGTDCLAGHEPGRELADGKLGDLPSAKLAKIGIGLIMWAMFGLAFLGQLPLLNLALIVAVLWMLFSFFVAHRAGHRGRCRRTRAWRQAWGGLVPTPREDPTREA
ncbi:MAG: hypothetical protein ACOYEV_01715 [Candidatus Nanopelagicales bacterium]